MHSPPPPHLGWMPSATNGPHGGPSRPAASAIALSGDFTRTSAQALGPSQSSATITAAALLVASRAAYFGFARKLRSPAPASARPAMPVISKSPSPFKTPTTFSVSSASFMTSTFLSCDGYSAQLARRQANCRNVDERTQVPHSSFRPTQAPPIRRG